LDGFLISSFFLEHDFQRCFQKGAETFSLMVPYAGLLRLPARPLRLGSLQRERSVKIKLKIKKPVLKIKILKIKDLAAKIKSFSS